MGARFPARGLLPALGLLICAALTLWIGTGVLRVDPGTLSVYLLFATWFAFVLSTAAGWPLGKVPQPARGLIFLLICGLYGLFHMWAQPRLFGFSADYFWPAIANLFLAIGITISFEDKLVAGLKQPIALIMNVLFWYLFAYLMIIVVPVNNGMVPAIWFAFFLVVVFWFNRWPVAEQPQPSKGILSFVMMVAGGVLLNYIFVWFFKSSFFQANANSWFAVWVFWLVMSSWIFDTWPLHGMKQPAKGVAGVAMTVVLASITYALLRFVFGIDLANLGSYVWVFICWAYLWPICLGKWPATEKAAPAPTPKPAAGKVQPAI